MNKISKDKSEFYIDLTKNVSINLPAQLRLESINAIICNHYKLNLRLPLGIYNISVHRICSKLIICCEKLEKYILFKNDLRNNRVKNNSQIDEELIDYIELSLYAAAEHVDDIRAIARGFYKNDKETKSSTIFRSFDEEIKKYKWLISASINAIKHQQARIRLASIDFTHNGVFSCLHGYFIEGVKDGIIIPNDIFHKENRTLFSITTLIWEIVIFLLHSSKSLVDFLDKFEEKTSYLPISRKDDKSNIFNKTIIAATRLPLYTFDDIHPFSHTRLIVYLDEGSTEDTNSGIYGSIQNKWSKSEDGITGNFEVGFQGDGISTQFTFPRPSILKLEHWE